MKIKYILVPIVSIACLYAMIQLYFAVERPPQQIESFAAPSDPYDPLPLRVGTLGAKTYHNPFCPYAKQSLVNYGIGKRVNYWTRAEIAASGRVPDTYCLAGIFNCENDPSGFVNSDNDPWCGANIRSSLYKVEGIDAELAGKTLCSLHGHTGIFTNRANDCVDGNIRASGAACDPEVCRLCTDNCEIPCQDCVKVTVTPLNKVAFAMSDANADGESDQQDYLYYHECYSGTNVATLPCQNVFDYDADGDVDVTDFDLFVKSYNSGNITWASTYFPGTNINPKSELPLRVGTNGSAYYHRLDCPSVNKSWEKWGLDRRIDFFTWDQIEASGRIPDTTVCSPGTINNPEG